MNYNKLLEKARKTYSKCVTNAEKNMIATTIEQSKKLIELGIDVNTADMTYNAIVVSGEDKMLINGWVFFVSLNLKSKENVWQQ